MNDDVTFGLLLSLVGISIVFVVLAAIAVVVFLIRRLDEGWQAREQAEEIRRLERPPTIDATTAVVITAAVATYVAGRYRIRSVRRLLAADAPSSPWSHQGRAVVQGSHVIQRRPR